MIYKLIFIKINYIYKKRIIFYLIKKLFHKKYNIKIEKNYYLNII